MFEVDDDGKRSATQGKSIVNTGDPRNSYCAHLPAHHSPTADDNYHPSSRLSEDHNQCHNEIDSLRDEFNFAKRCIRDLEENMMINGSSTECDMSSRDHELETKIYRLRDENSRLKSQLSQLQRQVRLFKESRAPCSSTQDKGNRLDMPCEADDLRAELALTKEALSVAKADRKRLKHEKIDLLNQTKEVYHSLELKEQELREFIKDFDVKLRESDQGIKQLIWEKQNLERERDSLLRTLEKVSAQTEFLKADLTKEQRENGRLQAQLKELQGRFLLLTGQTVYNCAEATPQPACHALPGKELRKDVVMAQSLDSGSESTLKEGSTSFERIPFGYSFRRHRSSQEPQESNRISRLFGFVRSKTREDLQEVSSESEVDPIARDLNLAERADNLLRARSIPMAQWRQLHITAWLRLELGMSQYVPAFEANVKSGKALSELTDADMENTLAITNPMHKKKLRLAIEDYRVPSLCKYPNIKEMTYQYVCNTFLPSIGLSQYKNTFLANLVDARVLHQLNKKQMSKYLGITKRMHQKSFLYGVEVLRMVGFDAKVLAKHRVDCDRKDGDVLWWTNERLMRWIHQIDLAEYSNSLKNSGVHGALMALDPSFGSEQLADLMEIPSSKQMIRRHLQSKYEPLLAAERARLLSMQRKMNSAAYRCSTLECDHLVTNALADNVRQSSVKESIGRLFGVRSQRLNSDNLIESDRSNRYSAELSLKIAKDEMETIESRKLITQSTGTLSSATSDLGGSIERSQHMKAILGTPHVLIHAPMTGISAEALSAGVDNNATDRMVMDTNDLSHLCLSPGEQNPLKNRFVRLRKKKSFVGRSPGANPRPHSMNDFLLPQQSSSGGFLFSKFTFGSSPLATKLKNWLSVDRLSSDSAAEDPSSSHRPMVTIAEYGEAESEEKACDSAFSSGSSSKQSRYCYSRDAVKLRNRLLERPRSLALPSEWKFDADFRPRTDL